MIVRNLKQEGRHKSYDDMEVALVKVLRQIGLNNIKVNYIRRLPKPKGDISKDPMALKVELSCLGDKIRIFNALEGMLRNKAKF